MPLIKCPTSGLEPSSGSGHCSTFTLSQHFENHFVSQLWLRLYLNPRSQSWSEISFRSLTLKRYAQKCVKKKKSWVKRPFQSNYQIVEYEWKSRNFCIPITTLKGFFDIIYRIGGYRTPAFYLFLAICVPKMCLMAL